MNMYYLNQKIDVIKDKYIVSDINKQPIFNIIGNSSTGTVDRIFGNFFSIGHTLYINNIDGEEKFIIKKKPGFIWSNYDMLIDNNISASIHQDKSWLKPKFSVNSQYGKYTISGDSFAKHFTVNEDGNMVAKFDKKTLSLTDTYEICVYDPDVDNLIIAIVIAIDNSIHS